MGKGDKRRREDTKKIDRNWDKIRWKKDSTVSWLEKWLETIPDDDGDWRADARRRKEQRSNKQSVHVTQTLNNKQ